MTHEQFVENQSSKASGLKVEVADEVADATEAKEATPVSSARASMRNIDLNLDPADEDDEVAVPPEAQPSAPATVPAAANLGPAPPATSSASVNLGLTTPAASSAAATAGPSVPGPKEGAKLKDLLGGWELPDMNKMDMDPIQFALSANPKFDEDEDYDNED
jgi:hypothetical protein